MANLTTANGDISWTGVLDMVQNFEDITSQSLTQYTKRATINSRVYTQEAISDNDILPEIIKLSMNIYAGLILTAMEMNQFVTAAHTVRDSLSVVATESLWQHLNNGIELYKGNSTDPIPATEALPLIAGLFKPNTKNPVGDLYTGKTDAKTSGPAAGKVIDHTLPNSLPTYGRVIEVTFGDIKKDSNKPDDLNNRIPRAFTLHMFLQLHQMIISDEVARAFVTTNILPSLRQRWIQYTTGEISFWNDFARGLDILKARKKALLADKTGALYEMYKQQANAVSQSWLKMSTLFKEKQNIASSIMIFDKNMFLSACKEAGLNFYSFNDRQRFMNRVFSLMVILVNQDYNKVELFFHGLNFRAEYNFNQIKSNAKNDKFDLMDIMQSMSRGMAPKF